MSRKTKRIALTLAALTAAFAYAPSSPVAFAAFPGMNGRIAWNQSPGNIVTARPNGSQQRLLAEGLRPTWSPDGEQIVFDQHPHGITFISVMNADGTGVHRLTEHGFESSDPAWSPDGEHIVFIGQPHSEPDIYVMNADGTGVQRLTRHGSPTAFDVNVAPAWSPNGDRIAYVHDGGSDSEIMTMDPDGGNKGRITHSTANEGSPSWSPDGQRIAFASDAGGDAEIYTMAADGSDPQQLTDNTVPDLAPAYSPDGTRILFARAKTNFGNSGIWAMTTDGSHEARVIGGKSFDGNPDWGPA